MAELPPQETKLNKAQMPSGYLLWADVRRVLDIRVSDLRRAADTIERQLIAARAEIKAVQDDIDALERVAK